MSRIWEQKIFEATRLLSRSRTDKADLVFYIKLLQFQNNLYLHVGSKAFAKVLAHPPHYPLRERLELRLLLPLLPNYFTLAASSGPAPLAQAARRALAFPRNLWESLLLQYWQAAGANAPPHDPLTLFLAKGFLQPYAELLVERSRRKNDYVLPDRYCPVCGHLPQFAVIREIDDDMQFSLSCSLCETLWIYSSMLCPGCGGRDPRQMHYEPDPEASHVQAQGCGACRRYIKSVDMASAPQSIPTVAEVVSAELDARMVALGYQKIEVNVLGR